jgi:diguanylate cyclase
VTKAKKRNQTPTLLNTDEAEVIVHELGHALDVHREWIEEFRAMLVCRTPPKATDLNADSHEITVFGRWYYGEVNPYLGKHPDFLAVGKHNESMHAIARNLASTVQKGANVEPAEYQALVKSDGQFRISVRKLLSETWNHLRHTDPLTGVMTRAAMQARLEGEQERALRDGQTCIIGVMDLDHFKSVNDTHGHQIGDQVLQEVAGYVAEHLRRYDQVFRYGGEEFVLVLPNTTTENAKRVLDRLRLGVKRRAIKIGDDKTLHVSASFGVAELVPDTPTKDSIERADQALYAAKSAGRNRVHVWKSVE